MKGTNEVLSMARVDGSLAADRGIDLCKQRRRNLHAIEAAANNRSGEPSEVADYASTQRHDQISALRARGEQRVANLLEHRKTFRFFTCRYRDACRADSGAGERRFGRSEMMLYDCFIADDCDLGAGPQGGHPLPQRDELTAADHDRIAA